MIVGIRHVLHVHHFLDPFISILINCVPTALAGTCRQVARDNGKFQEVAADAFCFWMASKSATPLHHFGLADSRFTGWGWLTGNKQIIQVSSNLMQRPAGGPKRFLILVGYNILLPTSVHSRFLCYFRFAYVHLHIFWYFVFESSIIQPILGWGWSWISTRGTRWTTTPTPQVIFCCFADRTSVITPTTYNCQMKFATS